MPCRPDVCAVNIRRAAVYICLTVHILCNTDTPCAQYSMPCGYVMDNISYVMQIRRVYSNLRPADMPCVQ